MHICTVNAYTLFLNRPATFWAYRRGNDGKRIGTSSAKPFVIYVSGPLPAENTGNILRIQYIEDGFLNGRQIQ